MVQLKPSEGGFDLLLAGRTLLASRPDSPAISLACGEPQVAMVRGNFRLSDHSVAAAPLTRCNRVAEGAVLLESADGSAKIRVECSGAARLSLIALSPHDRVTVHFVLAEGDVLWGGGEQMSYLALNGRTFPIWTSEPGEETVGKKG